MIRRLLLVACCVALAAPALAGPIDGGGHVSFALRADPEDGKLVDLGDTIVAGGWLGGRFADDLVGFRAALDVRLHGPSDADRLDEAETQSPTELSLRLRDAWIELEVESSVDMALRVGVQEIRWGATDALRVADPVSPYDLENPIDQDRRLAIPAMSVLLHKAGWSFQVVAVPIFFRAAMPRGSFDLVPDIGRLLPDELGGQRVQEVVWRLDAPEPSLKDVGVGSRLFHSGPVGDFGLSWYWGRDSLPQADGSLVITGFQTDQDRIDVAVPLTFPRRHILAADYRGDLGAGIGLAAELAVLLPAGTKVTAPLGQLEALVTLGTLDQVPDPLPGTETQDGHPVVHATVAVDRAFGPVRVLLSYLRGFPTERRMKDVEDYLFAGLRWSIIDSLVLDFRSMTDFDGWLVGGGLTWLYRDTFELGVAATWTGGPTDSLFHRLRGLRHVALTGKVTF